MPPVHPALVHYPIALVTLAVLADIIGMVRPSAASRAVGWWCLLAGFVGGGLAIAGGYFDMSRAALAEETHELVHQHLRVGWLLAIVLALLAVWRGWIYRRQEIRAVSGAYLTAAVLGLGLTFFQGWYGGELAYGHGAGVAAAGQGMTTPEKARARVVPIHEFLDRIPGLRDHDEHGEESVRHP